MANKQVMDARELGGCYTSRRKRCWNGAGKSHPPYPLVAEQVVFDVQDVLATLKATRDPAGERTS